MSLKKKKIKIASSHFSKWLFKILLFGNIKVQFNFSVKVNSQLICKHFNYSNCFIFLLFALNMKSHIISYI